MTRTPTFDRRSVLRAGIAAGALALAGCSGGSDDDPASVDEVEPDGPFQISEVVSGLDAPWGIAFLPETSQLLVTELPGGLQLVDREDETMTELTGTPEVVAAGQGGLLDVAVHPDFPAEPWIYLTYAGANDEGETATHLGRGRLDLDGPEFSEFEAIHVAEPFLDRTAHYGSRVEFGTDGMIYMTAGDRQFKNFDQSHVAQDLTNELGTTLRLAPDGTVPADNPFVDDSEAVDSIFTYGHRNPQGIDVHPETGEIWVSEHGEKGGDEINRLRAGGNYGWPIADQGCEYGTEEPVAPDPQEGDGTIPAAHVWACGVARFPPAGMTFYEGDTFPDWQGDLFVGNLAGQYLGHLTVSDPAADDPTLEEVDPLLDGNDWRVRDVAVAPDTGHLYVAIDSEDAPLVRLHSE
ncbi:PQQ-dependent sugar dehydrogenase [Halovenus sp. HT40]|uniref:PQQ-dependent sugar dehydrogenase n=1 Tax=Halovenus sp. HT40 TaxID=3126691 RepID=UPI00300F673D